MNFDFIKKALSENDNAPSSIRLFAAYSIGILVPVIAFGFIYVVFAYKEYITAYAGILSGLITMIYGAKTMQKGKENNTSENQTK